MSKTTHKYTHAPTCMHTRVLLSVALEPHSEIQSVIYRQRHIPL